MKIVVTLLMAPTFLVKGGSLISRASTFDTIVGQERPMFISIRKDIRLEVLKTELAEKGKIY